MSVWPNISNYLLKYQVSDEDQLFNIIYQRKYQNKQFPLAQPLLLKEAKDDDLLEDEYFTYKQDTYLSFIVSGALTIPTAFLVAGTHYYNRHLESQTLKLQRMVKLLLVMGIPSFSLYNYGVFRRFFVQIPSEVLLKKKYAPYLETKENSRRNY